MFYSDVDSNGFVRKPEILPSTTDKVDKGIPVTLAAEISLPEKVASSTTHLPAISSINNNASKILLIGDFVIRGPDWGSMDGLSNPQFSNSYGDSTSRNGVKGNVGVVTAIKCAGIVLVRWFSAGSDTAVRYPYRYDYEGKYDIQLVLPMCRPVRIGAGSKFSVSSNESAVHGTVVASQTKYKHWLERVSTAVVSMTGVSTPFKCSCCGVLSLPHPNDPSQLPVFHCYSCSVSICAHCYHKRPPPISIVLASKFCLRDTKRLLRERIASHLSENQIDNLLVEDQGDLQRALQA